MHYSIQFAFVAFLTCIRSILLTADCGMAFSRPAFSRPLRAWTVERGDVVFTEFERKTQGTVRIILRHHGEGTLLPCAQKKKPLVARCWTSVTVHEQCRVNGVWVDRKELPLHPDRSRRGWRLRLTLNCETLYLHKMIAYCWPGEGQVRGHGSTWSAAGGPFL